jgi:hypothetical protein
VVDLVLQDLILFMLLCNVQHLNCNNNSGNDLEKSIKQQVALTKQLKAVCCFVSSNDIDIHEVGANSNNNSNTSQELEKIIQRQLALSKQLKAVCCFVFSNKC